MSEFRAAYSGLLHLGLHNHASLNVGNSGILDVIDAHRRLAQARLGLSGARAQRLLDTAQLYVTLGGTPVSAAGSMTASADGAGKL